MKKGKMKKVLLIVISVFLIVYIGGMMGMKALEKRNKRFLNLSEEQKLQDYDEFWSIMRENYPFMSVVERKGVDIEALYDEYRENIIKVDTDIDFFKEMSFLTREFKSIGHLGTLDGLKYDSFKKIYSEDLRKGNEEYKYFIEILDRENVINTYSQLALNKRGFRVKKYLRKDLQDINANEIPVSGDTVKEDNIVTEIKEQGKTAIIKVNSFKVENIESDRASIIKFMKEIKNYENLIIDIRGNRGGSDGYWKELLVAPIIQDEKAYYHYSMVNNGAYNKKYVEAFFALEDRIDASELPHMPKIQNEDIKEDSLFIRDGVKVLPLDSNEDMFKGKVWVLVDGAVTSSAEMFAKFCKNTGFATIVGEETAGDGGVLDSVLFNLKNSGLVFRYRMDYGFNPDGTCNEEVGTKPDIEIAEGDDSLQICLKNIK